MLKSTAMTRKYRLLDELFGLAWRGLDDISEELDEHSVDELKRFGYNMHTLFVFVARFGDVSFEDRPSKFGLLAPFSSFFEPNSGPILRLLCRYFRLVRLDTKLSMLCRGVLWQHFYVKELNRKSR